MGLTPREMVNRMFPAGARAVFCEAVYVPGRSEPTVPAFWKVLGKDENFGEFILGSGATEEEAWVNSSSDFEDYFSDWFPDD